MALCLTIAIKNKASNEEIFSILKDVPNPNQDDDDGKIHAVTLCQAVISVQTDVPSLGTMSVVICRTVCFSF